ncbi:MAG: sporulation protein YqfD, partial [Clostridia bacterium]|nr:sporulation protein YqfD [Clostridia bacterium]
VITKGNTLIINIKEKLHNAEYEDKQTFMPLVSNVNGIITELSIVQGSAKVKVGDMVKVGDELVSPSIIDSNGNEILVKPLADIKADIYFTNIIVVPDQKIMQVKTGKKSYSKCIMLFNAQIFNPNKTPSFDNFITETNEYYLTSNNILPIKVIETKYEEVEYIQIDDYFKNNRDYILEEVKQKTRQNVRIYDIIKDEYYEITSCAGINRITYTVLASGSVF